MKPRTVHDLTAAEQWVVRTMSANYFGWIANLRIRDSQPVVDQEVRVVRITRFPSNAVALETGTGDFELKRAVMDLFEEFRRIGNGVVQRLQFRYGLPTEVEVSADSNKPPFF